MTSLAITYAKAAAEAGLSYEVLCAGRDFLSEQEAVYDCLLTPNISVAEKASALKEPAPFSETPALLRFVCLLIENGRLRLFDDVILAYHLYALSVDNGSQCLVTCVNPPDADLDNRLSHTRVSLSVSDCYVCVFSV